MKKLSFFLILILGTILLAACSKTQKVIVKFDFNDGVSAIFEQEVVVGEFIEEPEKPERANYEFDFWQVKGMNKKWDFKKDKIEESLILVAQWKEINYFIVSFNINHKDGINIQSQQIKEGNKAVRPTETDLIEDEFLGWYLSESDTKEFDFNTAINRDINLIAKWEKNEITAEIIFTDYYLGDLIGALYTNNEFFDMDAPVKMQALFYNSLMNDAVNYPNIKPKKVTANLPSFKMPYNNDGIVLEEIGNGLYLTVNHNPKEDEEHGTLHWRKGLSNIFGEWILEPEEYIEINHFYNDIAVAKKFHTFDIDDSDLGDKRYGYLVHIFEHEQSIVKNMYDEDNVRFYTAGSFQGDYAVVSIIAGEDQKYGVINKKGEYVVEPNYDYIHKEIVNDKVIVANNIKVQYEGYISEFGYYSEEIGVYDLKTKSLVIPMENDIVTYLSNNKYFTYQKEANVSKIVDIENNEIINVSNMFFNMINYDDDYYIGFKDDHLYLIEKDTLKLASKYDRYYTLLEYFNIPYRVNKYDDLVYNFDTLTKIERKVDFIRSNLYFYGGSETDLREKIGNNIIDAKGNVVLELEEGYAIYYPEWDVNIKGYNSNILYPDGLIIIRKMVHNATYEAINFEGELIAEGFSQVTTFQNGKSLVTKKHTINDQEIELMYTLYKDGSLVPVDIGIDYFKQNIDYLASLSNKKTRIKEYLPGVYHIKIFIDFIEDDTTTHEEYIINAYGDIIFDQRVREVLHLPQNEVNEYSDFVKRYFEEQDMFDMLYISTSGHDKTAFKVIRNDEINDFSEERSSKLVMLDEKVFIYYYNEYSGTSPYMFNFEDGSEIEVYINDKLINPEDYIYYPNIQHLEFTYDYVNSLENIKTEYKVISGEQEVMITLLKEGVALSTNEFFRAIGNYLSYQDVHVASKRNATFYMHLESLKDLKELTIVKLNGKDILDYVNLSNETLSFDVEFFETLDLGYYVIEFGDENKIATTTIIIIEDDKEHLVNLYDGQEIVGYKFSNRFNEVIHLPSIQKEGYEFIGWFLDESYNQEITYPLIIFEDIDVYGKWIEK